MVTATDHPALATASTSFTLTIINEFPTKAVDISSVSYHLGDVFEIIVGSNIFVDRENDPLTYSATKSDDSALPSWLIFDEKVKKFYGNPKLPSDTTTHSIKVTVKDPYNTRATDIATSTFTITILNNDPTSVGIAN